MFRNLMLLSTACFAVLCLSSAIEIQAAEPYRDAETLMCERGRLVLSDDFNKTLGKHWRVLKGQWDVSDGVLIGAEIKSDHHGAIMRTPLQLRNLIIQYSFKIKGARSTTLTVNDPQGHNSRVSIRKGGMAVRKDDHDHTGPDQAVLLQNTKFPVSQNQWHTLVVEWNGPEILARLDGKQTAYGSNAAIDVDKKNFGFTVAGSSVAFRHVRVWEATPNSNWPANKAKLLSHSAK